MSTTTIRPFHSAGIIFLLALINAGVFGGRAAAQEPAGIPDSAGQVMLIKNTLVALNHANMTGNYTVLRDLAGKRFQQQNKPADLAATFANLRKQKLDLSPILVSEPKLTRPPATDQIRGRLQLVGYFPTRPQAVRFALIFQSVSGGWVIDEISVSLAPAESVVESSRPPQSPGRALPSRQQPPPSQRLPPPSKRTVQRPSSPNSYPQPRTPYR